MACSQSIDAETLVDGFEKVEFEEAQDAKKVQEGLQCDSSKSDLSSGADSSLVRTLEMIMQ